tara:strand:- start:6934 stop:7095 length:162 start_codon:yes stop_codon:yes gene_type:complete
MEIKKKAKGKTSPPLAHRPIKKDRGNGKGDSPRSLTPAFRDNYSSINWSKKKS